MDEQAERDLDRRLVVAVPERGEGVVETPPRASGL
jgi:hypothetical protein